MTYFLKTSPICSSNCVYCDNLGKKAARNKRLGEIKQEVVKVRNQGFVSVRVSCNTDRRKDFFKILRLIKKNNLEIILETNAGKFSSLDFFKETDKYVDRYEVYASYSDIDIWKNIMGEKGGYRQFQKGAGNILKFSRNKKTATVKIVITNDNLPFLISIIDRIKQWGAREIKLILPFQAHLNDSAPSLVDAVPAIALLKNYAAKKELKISIDGSLEHSPYSPEDTDFFKIEKAELKLDFKKYPNKPKFSVIIPTHNKKNSLKFVLNNFFKQDYPKSKYEIIVVDDGSDDGTLESIKKIKPSCNFKYFYWPRKNIRLKDNFKKWAKFYNRVGLARNIGINHAQGEIILFNDADILTTRDCLKRHERYHNRYPNIIVRGFRAFLPEKFNPDSGKIEDFNFLNKISCPEKTERGKRIHCRMYNLSREGWQKFITANLSLRKKYLEQINGFGGDFVFWGFEDVDVGYRLSKLKMGLIWDDKIKVYHLYHPKEPGSQASVLFALWLGANILYRKYFDKRIYNIYGGIILRNLDNLILGLPQIN